MSEEKKDNEGFLVSESKFKEIFPDWEDLIEEDED